jgi:hypothetical protein
MKKSVLTTEEKKAKKAARDKAYRDRKKAGIVARPAEEVVEAPEAKAPKAAKKAAAPKKTEAAKAKEVYEAFEKTFGFPVRLYWNMRMERENSSCAKAGTPLSFEEIKEEGKVVAYRVRRGKRNFFTTPAEIKAAE